MWLQNTQRQAMWHPCLRRCWRMWTRLFHVSVTCQHLACLLSAWRVQLPPPPVSHCPVCPVLTTVSPDWPWSVHVTLVGHCPVWPSLLRTCVLSSSSTNEADNRLLRNAKKDSIFSSNERKPALLCLIVRESVELVSKTKKDLFGLIN